MLPRNVTFVAALGKEHKGTMRHLFVSKSASIHVNIYLIYKLIIQY